MQKWKLICSIFALTLFQSSWGDTVTHYQLTNGLNLFVKVDTRAPVVISEVWYKVGSSYEPNGITGISHALEHMMFEGSQNYPGNAYSTIIAKNGGDDNAVTDYDYTYYYATLAANKLDIDFQLEADRMKNLLLSSTAFDKEINVVKEERRMRTDTNPQGLTYERFMASAFLSTPYHHPVVGWMNDLNQMTINDLHNWYQQWYAPNNAIVVVVGDVDPVHVYQLAEKYFGSIPAHQLPIVKSYSDIAHLGEKTVSVSAPAKLPWIIMGYSVPSIKTAQTSWEPYALELAADVLDSGSSSRFPTELIRGSQVASSANASYDPFSRLSSLFILYGTPAAVHSISELQNNFSTQIKQLQTTLVSPEELARIKTQLLAQKTYAKDSIANQAELIGALEAVGLSWQIGENYVTNVDKITAKQIQAVAKKYFVSNRLTIAYLKPTAIDSSIPTNTSPNPIQGDIHVH